MPTYEYACENCAHEFEEFQSITAKPLKQCPECGKRKLQRLIGTGGGVIFKGSGFYQTDYRSESYKKAAEAEKTAGSNAKSGGDDKKQTAAKPEKNSEPKASKPKADSRKAG